MRTYNVVFSLSTNRTITAMGVRRASGEAFSAGTVPCFRTRRGRPLSPAAVAAEDAEVPAVEHLRARVLMDRLPHRHPFQAGGRAVHRRSPQIHRRPRA